MAKNVYRKWEPVPDLPIEMYVEALHDDYEGFRVLLKGRDERAGMLRIAFYYALTYRNVDEGDLISYDRQDEGGDLGRWGFFVVSTSDYLEWFLDVSHGLHDRDDITHYAIYTPNDCIDVLSKDPPKVEWLSGEHARE